MGRLICCVLAGLSVFVTGLDRGHAGVLTLDQSYDAVANGSNGGINVSSTQTLAQTFTVGIGGLLAQVDLQARLGLSGASDDLVLTILGTSGGIPDLGNVLGSVSISPGSVPPFSPFNSVFVNVDVSGLGISVTNGDVLALELSYPTGTGNYVWLEGNDTYTGGDQYFRSAPGTSWSNQFSDAGFQTWVEVGTVPEPSSLALLGMGVSGLCGYRLRRKRRLAA